jgi:hypothetical protein
MPLPVPQVERELTHTRRVRYEGYKRADGLWDIEAHLVDTKNHDYRLKTGVRRAGQPIHDMWLRLTIDRSFTVLEASACTDAVPYPGGCETIAPAYRKLVGLNLLRGFRKRAPGSCSAPPRAAPTSPSCSPACRRRRSRPSPAK